MRDYAKISPQFWTQGTGKALRKHPEAQIVALYLMTAPLSEMTGVFYCPMWAIAGETGLGEEGASKGLQRLIEVDFCTYDTETETVFVHEMAKYQIAEELKESDNQVKSIRKAFSSMTGDIKQRFFERYSKAFHLSPSEAPSKPGAGTGTGTEDKHPSATGKNLPDCPTQKLVEIYHELMPMNPRLKVLNPARQKSIRARWLEAATLDCKPFGYQTQEEGLAAWRVFFEVCAQSKFLTGRTQSNGKPPFFADIDFLFSPSGFTKALENKYHRE